MVIYKVLKFICYDFIIAADNKKEYDFILQNVIDRTRKYNIKFNSKKLQYCQSQVKFLGHLFDHKGISIDTDRIKAIKLLNEPNNKKELQRLLGFINYVRKFVPNLVEMSDPLRNLLKKDVEWQWNEIHSHTLKKIKEKLINAPV